MQDYEKRIEKREVIHALTSFSNNKLLAKYGLIKEF